MRIKQISLLALVLVLSASALPVAASANSGKDETPPVLKAALEGETVKIESSDDNSGVEAVFIDGNRVNSLTNGNAAVALKDYAGSNKKVGVYAVDYAGNQSETVEFENPYYEEPSSREPEPAAALQSQAGNTTAGSISPAAAKPAQTQSIPSGSETSAEADGSSDTDGNENSTDASGESTDPSLEDSTSSIPEGAFTPDGTGTVLDEATGADGDKQFYTITTDAGNVFYLVVDGKRDSKNVYFLNGVTESDLAALAEKGDGSINGIPDQKTCTCADKCETGKANADCPVCKNDLKGCTGKKAPAEEPKPKETEQLQKEKGGSASTIIFIVIAMLAVAGIGYYVKIVRPKQQAAEDDFEDDGYGEGFDPDEAYGEPEYLSEDDFDDRDENSAGKDSK